VAVVGVIPAAGHATRLQPLGMSKEVYPVGGRPVMDYLVERMRAAPCTELRVVTRPDKRDVMENAARHGATVIRAIPATLAQSLVAGTRGLADDDLVLLGFPDSIWEPVNGFARIIPLLQEGCEVALGLFFVADPGRHEPVVLDDSGKVLRIEFKPTRPSASWIWGCAVAAAQTLRGLEHEDEPGVLFDSLCEAGGVVAVRLSDTYIDMGTPAGLREALERVPGDRA
jgi:glucose-1-phosphate thymidylyltransferase